MVTLVEQFFKMAVLIMIYIIITSTAISSWENLDCKPCPVGHYMVKPCNEKKSESVCKPCKAGSYNSKSDFSISCEDCQVCDLTEEIGSECTAVSNRVCRCPAGTDWKSVGADGYCAKK